MGEFQGEDRILVVNKNIPYMRSDYMAHISDATCIVEMDEPLVSIPNLEPSPALEAISTFIADQTCDGACIQMGIGDLSTAVGFGLRNKNDLGIHSEMMGDSMMELVKRGNVTNTRKTYLPGVSSAAFLSPAGPVGSCLDELSFFAAISLYLLI